MNNSNNNSSIVSMITKYLYIPMFSSCLKDIHSIIECLLLFLRMNHMQTIEEISYIFHSKFK